MPNNEYKFYQFQQIPTPNYDEEMKRLAALFQETLKKQLAKPYPYAPGYNGQRKTQGFRDMKKKTGSLYNSIRATFDPESDQIKVVMLEYWKYVNDGRKPGHYVPIKPLMDWIKVKGFNRDTRGRFKKFNIKGTAFAISRNIYKFGIRPTNFYDDSFDVFVESFEDPDGPISQLGIDFQEFIKKIINPD